MIQPLLLATSRQCGVHDTVRKGPRVLLRTPPCYTLTHISSSLTLITPRSLFHRTCKFTDCFQLGSSTRHIWITAWEWLKCSNAPQKCSWEAFRDISVEVSVLDRLRAIHSDIPLRAQGLKLCHPVASLCHLSTGFSQNRFKNKS